MSKPARLRARPALEVMEEAVRLLRAAPAAALLAHFIGSVPCLLYSIYFFTDLSRSAFAREHLIGSALGFAVLYGWMKCWQAVFAARLRATLLQQAPPRWDFAHLARLAAAQVLLQPIGLVLRFVAAMIAIPYVWVATFFQNVSVLGDGETGLRTLCAQAWTETKRWPAQAHGIAWYLAMFGLFVFLNVAAFIAAVPTLLKSFLGLETVFSQHPAGMFEPTFFVTVMAVTHLLLDPLRKAVVALRCFHGRSLRTGEDLAVELVRVRRRALPAGVAVAIFLLLSAPMPPARAETAAPAIAPAELNHSIEEVLDRPEFTWRAAPTKPEKLDESKLSGFEKWRREVVQWKDRVARQTSAKIQRGWKRLMDWLFPKRGDSSESGHSLHWWNSVRALYWTALVVAAVLLAVIISRRWRRPVFTASTAEAASPVPDLRDETTTAEQLPEDGWLALSRELFDRGELRLALRALYLAGLAHLGSRELIHLARHKSNRDYDRELRRRARAQEDLLAAFTRNLEAFESSWYGDHTVTPEVLGVFSQNLERIRAC